MRRFPAVVVTTGKECATELIGSLLRWYADQLDVILVCNGCPEERIRQFRSQLRGQDRIRILPENRGGSGGFRVGMLEAEKITRRIRCSGSWTTTPSSTSRLCRSS